MSDSEQLVQCPDDDISPGSDCDDSRPVTLFAWPMIVAVMLYQRLVSPLLPASCRYRPTCSQYAVEALRRHGLLRGGWLGLKRILRCHPFHPGGHDPVP